MIQIIELHPHPLSVEHPQFVAVKSLISDHRITEEESASSSRFRRHCIRIRCCFRRKIHFRSRREEE